MRNGADAAAQATARKKSRRGQGLRGEMIFGADIGTEPGALGFIRAACEADEENARLSPGNPAVSLSFAD